MPRRPRPPGLIPTRCSGRQGGLRPVGRQQFRGTQAFDFSLERGQTALTLKRPADRSSHANPKRPWVPQMLANKLSRRSSSSASSVTVPGVTMRTTSRSIGPLVLPGSPRCSHIATDSPLRTSLARYVSRVTAGTPAIGIGAPAEAPRWVSAMSSNAAARPRRTSRKSHPFDRTAAHRDAVP